MNIWTPAEKRPRLLMCSKAGAGKTTLLLNLLTSVYLKEFDEVVFFTHPTKDSNKLYQVFSDLDPETNEVKGFSDAALAAVYEKHMEKHKEDSRFRTLIILDDCAYASDFKQPTNKGLLNEAMAIWRENNISFIVLVQELNTCSVGLRTGCRQFVLFHGSNIGSNIERICECYWFGDKKKFKAAFNSIKTPYSFILVDADENRLIAYDNETKKYRLVYEPSME